LCSFGDLGTYRFEALLDSSNDYPSFKEGGKGKSSRRRKNLPVDFFTTQSISDIDGLADFDEHPRPGVPEFWDAKHCTRSFLKQLRDDVNLLGFSNEFKENPKMQLYHVSFRTPFQVHFRFHPIDEEHLTLDWSSFLTHYQERSQRFRESFVRFMGESPESQRDLSQYALSNLLGSLGYSHGRFLASEGDQIALRGPSELLAIAPSRSAFPRGFLWDEGFHLFLVNAWNPMIS
jgi:hypothetical protein